MRQIPFRTGFGYDVHRLSDGYELWLGGIKIPYEQGLEGHSDADVLLHAVCDALLGAAALGDIGVHFPPTDMAFKGIDSKILLERTCQLIREAGYEIGNIDATVAAEAPKLNPHIPEMRRVMAEVMGIPVSAIRAHGLRRAPRGDGSLCYGAHRLRFGPRISTREANCLPPSSPNKRAPGSRS